MSEPKLSARRWVIPLTVVCVVLGGMLGIQVRSQQARGVTAVGRQTSALIERLTRSEAQIEQQRDEIERLRALLAEYEEEAAGERGLVRLMSEELQASRIALGLVAVKGPGIELRVSDSTMRGSADLTGEDLFVIHDVELLRITNELWAAGAEAIALNGQRLTVGSPIVCSARLIEVNGVPVASPFVFQAIGDKEKLISALSIRGGMLDVLDLLHFPVKLTAKDEIALPPVVVAPKHEFAAPVERENKG
jgi:uncharacterized protein YlxW (UPF0749 family)